MAARLASLDATRGLVVALMILVNTAAYIHYVNQFPAYRWLLHAHWAGFTLADAVFPAFCFIIGVSVAISGQGAPAPKAARIRRALWRALKLFIIGLFVSNLYLLADFDTLFRPMGVLQRLAVVSLAVLLAAMFMSPRARLVAAAAILILYWPLCLVPSPDGLETDLAVRGHNFIAWFDRFVLGPYRYVTGPEGYDPEGLLSTLPAIAQGLLGLALGEYVVAHRGQRDAIARQAVAGAVMIALGLLWGLWFPIIKDIWSSSFVLVSSGAATLLFAAAQALCDRRESPKPVPILTAFGLNAIAAYVLHILASIALEGDALKASYHWAAQYLPAQAASLVPVALFMALIWAALSYLMRRNWIVKL